MNRHILNLILILGLWAGAGTDCHGAEAPPPVSLSMLAKKADLVALAQVKDTDYVYTRSFPSEGSAFLKILIAYKPTRTLEDIIQINEEGLHPNECYFENPTVLEEGRRYLVFLQRDPDEPESYRGLEEGCAIEILVTGENRYALRFPVDGFNLSDNLDELVSKYDFRDNYALLTDDMLSPVTRNDYLARELITQQGDVFKYTHGVDLTKARRLIDPESLRANRH